MNDPTTARIVVVGLIAVAILCVGGVIALAAGGNAAPDALVLTIGTAVGALAGVLAPRGASGG